MYESSLCTVPNSPQKLGTVSTREEGSDVHRLVDDAMSGDLKFQPEKLPGVHIGLHFMQRRKTNCEKGF